MEKHSWWRLNPRKNNIHSIEWTPFNGGIVRAKLDSIAEWDYAHCEKCKYAESFGLMIIEEQKRRRNVSKDGKTYYDMYMEGYQGA